MTTADDGFEEDDNPEHLRLFTARALEELLTAAGAARVSIEHVRGHRVAVARVSR